MTDHRQVFVSLLDEGIQCWRPVEARHLQRDQFMLLGTIPKDEVWEFQPGEIVRCREQAFSGGEVGLVAFARPSSLTP